LEVKCPYCIRNCDDHETFSEKLTYLVAADGGSYALKHNHAYYFQVQGELFLANKEYCDLVVWAPNNVFFLQRIHRDEELWEQIVARC